MFRKAFASTLFFGLIFGLMHTNPAQAQDQYLPPQGGEGGGRYVARCAGTDILNGFEVRAGDDVDSIRPICVTAHTPTSVGPRHTFSQRFGGDGGGNPIVLTCPDNAPALAGLEVMYEGEDTVIVNNVRLYCSIGAPNQPTAQYPTAMFDGKQIHHTSGGPLTGYDPVLLLGGMQKCPQGLVPVGIHGGSGIWLDSMGLICGPLHFDQPQSPVHALGRVNSGKPRGPAKPICEAAADARARNSPAAPSLEAQCLASRKQAPIKSIGRVNTAAITPNAIAPNKSRTICDAARDSLGRKSPAAPSLVAQCRAQGGNSELPVTNADLDRLELLGDSIASSDFAAGTLRSSLDTQALRGYHIGLGVWQGNTAPGPGKQRVHDALIRTEQSGFDIAAAYSLPRNKFASLVDLGIAIAANDQEITDVRAGGGFYALGFDIATGLFGDPAAGAEGAKSLTPGAMAIRDTLNEEMQRGFNASMEMHLSRTYQ